MLPLLVLTADHYGVLTADVDGDGATDVVTHGLYHSGLSFFPNLGGTFGPRVDLVHEGIADVVPIDLEGDGLTDFCTATAPAVEVTCWPNLGGTLGAGVVAASAADDVHDLVAVDFDGDGDTDLLTLAPGAIEVHANDGAGVFATTFLADDHADRIAAGDLDGDGDLDLVTTDYGAREVRWFEDQGGTFADHLLRDDADDPRGVLLTDVDGDGDLDPIVRGGGISGSPGVVWYDNDGTGTFGPAQHLTTGEPLVAELGDLNGDGTADLVTSTYGSVGEWIPLPLGTRSGSAFGALGDGDHSIFDLAVAELDGDAAGDVITLTQDLQVWPGDGAAPVLVERGLAAASVHAAVDLDQDGFTDLIFAGGFDGRIGWHRGTATGFAPGEPLLVRETSGTPLPLDLDGDGDLDLVFTSFESGDVGWWENLGGGVFGPEEVFVTGLDNVLVQSVIDVDADGDRDLVVRTRSEVGWLPNLGGSFGPALFVDAGGTPTSAAAGDLDLDGDVDLAVTTSSDQVRIVAATAPGVFGPSAHVLDTLTNPDELAIGDVDGDGQPEVLFHDTCYLGDCQRIMAIAPGSVTPLTDQLRSFHLADVDGDGRVDLLGSTGTHVVMLLAADGYAVTELTTGNLLGSVVVQDLDGDGTNDLVGALHDEIFLIADLGLAPPPAHSGDTGAPEDTGTTGGTTPITDTAGVDTGDTGAPVVPGPEDEEKGCGCGSGGPAPLGVSASILLVLARVRPAPSRLS